MICMNAKCYCVINVNTLISLALFIIEMSKEEKDNGIGIPIIILENNDKRHVYKADLENTAE